MCCALLRCAPLCCAQVSSYGDKQMGPANEPAGDPERRGHRAAPEPAAAAESYLYRRRRASRSIWADYFGKRPAILALVYYRCPMLCSEELNGLTSALQMVTFRSRQGFRRHRGQHRSQREARISRRRRSATYLKRYGHPETADGWHFHDRHAGEYRRAYQGRRFQLREDSRCRAASSRNLRTPARSRS